MPSITYWNRLEPRARSSDLAGALAARVRDPAWFLARQWQLGELTGEDAGSPAYVRVAAAVATMVGWQAGTGSAVPIAANTPLERAALAEPMSTDDVSRSAELGTLLDTTLLTYDVADLRSHWLDAFPIGEAPADAPDDPRAARLRRLWQGRMIDGLAVYAAAIEPTSPPAPPAGVPPTVPPTRWAQCGLALEAFRAYIDSSHPGAPIGASDAATWLPRATAARAAHRDRRAGSCRGQRRRRRARGVPRRAGVTCRGMASIGSPTRHLRGCRRRCAPR
jgi:hypothetical protein